ncbi:MAG TPA: hypothetical protein VF651_11155, partial [Gammaproteobacteria bacterium]
MNLFASFAGNINYVVTGNTLRTQSNTGNPCLVGTTSNGTVSGIPAGSTVLAAYLYWAGSGSTTDYSVTLDGNTVNAAAGRQYTDTFAAGGGDNLSFFSGAADVSGIVTGNGTYTFGGLTVTTTDQGLVTYCGNAAVLAGWSLVVIYSNPSENNRVINVFEGFQAFRNSNITLNPNNFQIPSSGIDGKFSVITWEGDPDLNTGEDLQFNGNVLTDACDGANNQYNSTINTLSCTGTTATDQIYYGVDLDTFNIGSYLTAGNTSATTYYQAGGDLVYLSAQIVSVANTPVSDLSITKTDGVSSINAGSNTTYTLTVTNNGPAATAGTTTVTDVLPAGETFASASGTGWTCGNVSGTVTCTRSNSLASGASYPTISLTVTVGNLASNPIANTASVSGGNFDNVSGNNSATDSDTVTYPSADLAISKTAVGTFTAGAPVSYTITVTNNGPSAVPSGTTTTVSDTLPATLTYISATGTGWTCGAVGQVVTCTTTASVSSSSSFPTITLSALLSSSVAANVVNTATVSNAFITDGTAGNDSSTSTVTNASISKPNYSTSTKTWVDLNGGDVLPGDTIEYTISVKDSAAAAGTNIEVADNMPAGISSYSVISIPGGSTNGSTGTGTGSNGTGYLDITGISVPASGTVNIVFDVVVSGSAAPGDNIDNSATVIGGTAASTPTATTIVVQQSSVPASGNKILYVYDNQTLTRTPQTANTTGITVNENSTLDWTLSPAFQRAFTLSAGTVTVALMTARSGGNTNRAFFVELLKNGTTSLGTSGSTANFNSTTLTLRTLTVNVAATSFAAGDTLVLRVHNTSAGSGTRTMLVAQKTAANNSTITFATSTVINVDSVTVYSAAYSSTNTPPNNIFEPNTTVYIRAVISDPFGSYDIDPATGGTAPTLTLTDPNGTVQLTAVNMVQVADSGADTKTFEYYSNSPTNTIGYVLGDTVAEGFWTPTVKGF